MAIDERIAGMQDEMTKWRRDIHALPLGVSFFARFVERRLHKSA